jgi:hypothetical protein
LFVCSGRHNFELDLANVGRVNNKVADVQAWTMQVGAAVWLRMEGSYCTYSDTSKMIIAVTIRGQYQVAFVSWTAMLRPCAERALIMWPERPENCWEHRTDFVLQPFFSRSRTLTRTQNGTIFYERRVRRVQSCASTCPHSVFVFFVH